MAKNTTSIFAGLAKAALGAASSGKKPGAPAKTAPNKTEPPAKKPSPSAAPPVPAANGVASNGTASGGTASSDDTGGKIKFEPEKIKFGPYEWLVLERKDDTALIITEKVVKTIGYHAAREGATWEVSNIRKYLNSKFLEDFSPEEQARIIEVTNQNPGNPWFKTIIGEVNAPMTASGKETEAHDPKGGNPTKDKIFCLSIEEACRYFGDSTARLENKGFTQKGLKIELEPGTQMRDIWNISDENDANRTAKMTDKLCAIMKSKDGQFNWWLRSPGGADILAATVNGKGKIDFHGKLIWAAEQRDMGGVRPALWLRV